MDSLDEGPRFYPIGEYSDCIEGDYDGDEDKSVTWNAIKSQQKNDFNNVDSALTISLHSDINLYFTTWFSAPMKFDSQWGYGELLQAWNQDDFERLQQNIIGHLMMKQKLKQPLTWFIGVIDDEDKMITVNNEDGSVWFEIAGEIQSQKLASSLEEFINQLTPRVTPAEMPQPEIEAHIEHPGIFSSFKRMWLNLRCKN